MRSLHFLSAQSRGALVNFRFLSRPEVVHIEGDAVGKRQKQFTRAFERISEPDLSEKNVKTVDVGAQRLVRGGTTQ